MAKIQLDPDEAILKQDSRISHDVGKMFDADAELILTNKALLVVHKKTFGGVKDVQRFPLSQVKVVNGAPQVVAGRGSDGQRQLHVHFAHGVEAFGLGGSDDDEDNMSLKNVFTSPVEKEKRNIADWCDAVSRAVLGMPQDVRPAAQQSGGVVGGIMGALGITAAQSGADTASGAKGAAPQKSCATAKCIGCHAPLTGVQGQRMTCPYCDTEQVL